MKQFSIITNISKDNEFRVTKELISILEEYNIKYKLPMELAGALNSKEGYIEPELYEGSDAAIVLGGDGTILHLIRQTADRGLPIYGINLGHLGFLSSAEKTDVRGSIKSLIDGEFHIESRMMLKCSLLSQGTLKKESYALNEAVITRANFSRIIKLKIEVNDVLLDTFRADGVIISTPTGSTGYSLSAGGPIVDPELQLLIVTPICPHALYSRSYIVNPNDTIKIKLLDSDNSRPKMLTVDGQFGFDIDKDDEIQICNSNTLARIVKTNNESFYSLFRKKIYMFNNREDKNYEDR